MGECFENGLSLIHTYQVWKAEIIWLYLIANFNDMIILNSIPFKKCFDTYILYIIKKNEIYVKLHTFILALILMLLKL